MIRKNGLLIAVMISLFAATGCSASPDAAPSATLPPTDTPTFAPPTIDQSQPTSAATQIPAATLTSDEDLSQKEFVLRQFPPDFEKWFERPYPDEITGLADAELQGFRCTNSYFEVNLKGNPQLIYRDEAADETVFLTDTALTTIAGELNRMGQETDHHVTGLTYCEVEDGTEVVLYSFRPCDPPRGACSGDWYVGILDSGLITPIAAPRDETIPYMSCSVLLAVDKANNLYYRCSGGDGGGSGTAIFMINLISKEQTLLIDCDRDSGKITCE